MRDPVFGSLNGMLQSNRKHRYWIASFLCMALVVGTFTTILLIQNGVAMTRREKVIDCGYSPHQHTEACYDKNGTLRCGIATYGIHVHNTDCYDNGKLICPLPYQQLHVHTDSCYTETAERICGVEESAGHQHSETCYTRVQGEMICTDASEEHEHTDECYLWTEELICSIPEGEGAHTHTDACYKVTRELTCSEQTVLHVHTDSCYDEEGFPICGLLELTEHVHRETCFIWVEVDGEDADSPKTEPTESDPEPNEDAEPPGMDETSENPPGEEMDEPPAAANDPPETSPPDDSLPEETEKTEEFPFPEQSFEAEWNGLWFTVDADEGAFPPGTTMEIMTAFSSIPPDEAEELLDYRIRDMLSFEICFRNAEGEGIDPLIPILVTIHNSTISARGEPLLFRIDPSDALRRIERVAEPDADRYSFRIGNVPAS